MQGLSEPGLAGGSAPVGWPDSLEHKEKGRLNPRQGVVRGQTLSGQKSAEGREDVRGRER